MLRGAVHILDKYINSDIPNWNQNTMMRYGNGAGGSREQTFFVDNRKHQFVSHI